MSHINHVVGPTDELFERFREGLRAQTPEQISAGLKGYRENFRERFTASLKEWSRTHAEELKRIEEEAKKRMRND